MRGLRSACRAAWQQTKAGFTSLAGSPRDLYIVFVLKVLDSYNYFSLSRSLTLLLTEEFGVSDYRAGFWYGVWGSLLTAYGFILGGAIDFLGVRRSLVISFLLNCTSRLVMAATQSRVMLLVMLLGPNTIAGSLGIPVMTIGVKRYTHEGNRGFAFALFYTLMNCAALTQGVIMDAFRIGLRHGFRILSLPDHSLLNNGSRLFLASGCITSLIGLFVSFALHETAHPSPKRATSEVLEGSMHSHRSTPSSELELPTSPEAPLLGDSSDTGKISISKATPAYPGPRHRLHGSGAKPVDAVGQEQERPGSSSGARAEHGRASGTAAPSILDGVGEVLVSKGFWRYMAMCIFTVNLKGVFRHLDATLPKYQLRAFGCDTPIGLIYSINPAMIILLVPIAGAMLTELQHFDVIHFGSYISAMSPFWIVVFNTEWSTAAFVAMLSLGEAIWSPRWYDYSMSIAPNGREGIFTALASAPLFAAMLPTGMVSGTLLQAYCPDKGQCTDGDEAAGGSSSSGGRRLLALLTGRCLHSLSVTEGESPEVYDCNGRVLWMIVGLITLSSPLLVLLTQRWVRPDPQDFARPGATHRGRTLTEGECFDYNEADPTGLLENVYESSLLCAAESGGVTEFGGATGVSGHTAD